MYVVEQLGRGPFNRGALINAGFLVAAQQSHYVAIHDVDLLPLPNVDYGFPRYAQGTPLL